MSANSTTTGSLSVPSIIVLTISITSFVPGAIGLVFNVLVFTRPTLRREPCANYFLAATCFDLFIVFVVLPVRVFSNGFGMDLGNTNRGICKLESFTFNAARSTSCSLIASACIDRYLHSSSNIRIRRLSSVKTARVAIGITIITIFLAYSHYLIFYDVNYSTNQLGNIVSYCSSLSNTYNNFVGFFHMTFYSLSPSFVMLLFGSLTINQIRRRGQRQLLPVINEKNRVGRRTDIQLLRMLAAQVLVIIISTLPFSILRLYILLITNVSKDSVWITQINLASSVIVTIPYFAHTSSFYLYTLTGTIFRKELSKIVAHCIPHNQNRVNIHHVTNNHISAL